jgi:hypothetical protein
VIGSRASHVEIDVQGARTASIAFALGRIAFGVGLIAAPGRVAGGWLPGDAQRPATKVAIRGLGARDVALAAGLAVSARAGGAVRPWLAGCIACDAADIASTLGAGDALPARARWGTVALAGTAAGLGAALLAGADS